MKTMRVLDIHGDTEYDLTNSKGLEEAKAVFDDLVLKQNKYRAIRMLDKQKGEMIVSFDQVKASEDVLLMPHLQGG